MERIMNILKATALALTLTIAGASLLASRAEAGPNAPCPSPSMDVCYVHQGQMIFGNIHDPR